MKENKTGIPGLYRMTVGEKEILFPDSSLSGIELSGFTTDFLEKTIYQRMEETQSGSMEEYLSVIVKDAGEENRLKDLLYVGYSEFFRNSLTFAVLERLIFPSLFIHHQQTNRKELRIWSLACAGGQEAYSLAILLEELIKEKKVPWNYRIFATDKSSEQVEWARKGVFSQQSLAKVPFSAMVQWFDKQEGSYVVKPELKRRIDFSVFDLLDQMNSSPPASIFGDFVIVFCSNVLFYYKPEFRTAILEKATGCLSKDGNIVVGDMERSYLLNAHFHEVYPHSGIFRNKERE